MTAWLSASARVFGDPVPLILPQDLPLRAVEPVWEEDGVIARFARNLADGECVEQLIHLSSAIQEPAEAADDMAEKPLSTLPSEWTHVP